MREARKAGMKPATPSTTTRAASAASREALASLMKMLYPGVSRKFSLVFFHSTWASEVVMETLAGCLFLVEVGDGVGVAFVDAGEAVGRPAGIEKRRNQTCLAGVPVADNADVTNVLAFVDLHSCPLRG
jgi:hypothetical protein